MGTYLGVENKEHELNKNVLPCLPDILSMFVWRILAVSKKGLYSRPSQSLGKLVGMKATTS